MQKFKVQTIYLPKDKTFNIVFNKNKSSIHIKYINLIASHMKSEEHVD